MIDITVAFMYSFCSTQGLKMNDFRKQDFWKQYILSKRSKETGWPPLVRREKFMFPDLLAEAVQL